MALLAFYTYQQVTQALVVERNQALAQILASQLAAELTDHANTLLALTSRPDFDPAAASFQPQDPAALDLFDGGLLWMDANGTVTGSSPNRSDAVGRDLSAASYFQEARDTRQPAWSDLEAWGPGGEPVILLAVPLVGPEGDLEGAAAGIFRVLAGAQTRQSKFYVNAFRRLGIVEGENLYLVDRNGRAVLHSDTYRIGESIAGQAVVQQVLAGAAGGIRTQDLTGRPILASFAPVPNTPWSLVTEEDWRQLTAVSRRYQSWLLLLLALGALLPVLVVALGVRRITRPIERVTRAAQQIASGDLAQRIELHSNDELESLAHQFNRMATDLQESYAVLERRVQDRTRELAALNAVASVVSRSLDLEEIMQAALDKTLEITGLPQGVALCLDPTGGPPVIMAHRGLSPAFLEQIRALKLQGSIATEAIQSQRPVVRLAETYPDGPMKTAVQAEKMQMAVGIPLLARGRALGAINLGSPERRPLPQNELDLLAAIGQQVGVAVENARLYEGAEEAAAAAERGRLARDLHDAVSQTLFSASLIADVLPRLWERNPAEGQRRLEELRQLTRGALAEMRALLLELRPAALEAASLADLLRQLAEAITARARIPIQAEIEGDRELPVEVKEALYRLAQEALNNVVKHAGASRAALHLLQRPEQVILHISDDGQGFDPAATPPGHLGLRIMQERVEAIQAALEIDSQAGQGTDITITWRSPDPEKESS